MLARANHKTPPRYCVRYGNQLMNDLRESSFVTETDIDTDADIDADTNADIDADVSADIGAAVHALRRGQVVAFPTETVYGLGADASNPEAIAAIFAIKGRPANHPVIVHLASKDMLTQWAKHLSESAQKLADAFMPGPLTLIVERQDHVLNAVTGGQDSVGLRVPSHPLAHDLLKAFGGGVAAPSANRFGRISPTTAAHVRSEFADDTRVAHVLEGGNCQVGLESTIVDVRTEPVTLLRPGGVSVAELAKVLEYAPERASKDAPRTSGTLERHYAPTTPTHLMSRTDLDAYLQTASQSVAVVSVVSTRKKPASADRHVWRTLPAEPNVYGQMLYATLRDLDSLGQAGDVKEIIIEHVPDNPMWLAVQDRLMRASR